MGIEASSPPPKTPRRGAALLDFLFLQKFSHRALQPRASSPGLKPQLSAALPSDLEDELRCPAATRRLSPSRAKPSMPEPPTSPNPRRTRSVPTPTPTARQQEEEDEGGSSARHPPPSPKPPQT